MQPVTTVRYNRALVIDDNPAIHDDFKKILGEQGGASGLQRSSANLFGDSEDSVQQVSYEVDSAYQGQEGLAKVIEAARSHRPYCVAFVDLRMPPGWDGVETIEHVWQEDPDIHVVICSAYSDYSWSEIASRLGRSDQWLILKKPFDVDEVRQIVAALNNKLCKADQRNRLLTQSRMEIVWRLGRAAECRDEETGYHVLRVGYCSRAIAKTLGLSEEFQDRILLSSPLHDIGKIGIPDHILRKPGKLTSEEWETMKQHCAIGADILRCDPMPKRLFLAELEGISDTVTLLLENPLLDMAAGIALSHHERWDGGGYPHGQAGENIPLEARIVACADVFDALLSARPYKPAIPEDTAVAIMREQAGKHFDPQVHAAFEHSIDELRAIRSRFSDEG
jgi:putative two-component system response regulator